MIGAKEFSDLYYLLCFGLSYPQMCFQTSIINIDLGGVPSDSLNTFCHLGLVKPIFHSSSTKELIPIAWGSSQLPKEMCFKLQVRVLRVFFSSIPVISLID